MADLGKADGALITVSSELAAKEEHVCVIEKLPALSSGLLVRLAREGWPEGHVGDLHIDIRELSTKQWQHWGTVQLVGGDAFDTRPTEEEALAGATRGKPRLITHVEIIADWPGENPFANPRNKEERDTRKMLVQGEVRVRIKVMQPIRTEISMRTFTRPGAKLIESAAAVLGRA